MLTGFRLSGGPWGQDGEQKVWFLPSKNSQSSVCVVGYRVVLSLLFLSCVILGKSLVVYQATFVLLFIKKRKYPAASLLAERLKGDCLGGLRCRHHGMCLDLGLITGMEVRLDLQGLPELCAHFFPSMSRACNSLLALPERKAAPSRNGVLPGRNHMNMSKGGKTYEMYSWPKLRLVDFHKAGPYWPTGETCHVKETKSLGKVMRN